MTTTHTSHTRPLDAASMVLVVFICLTWGFNQPSVKLAIHDIPPLTQCAIRSVLSIFLVLALMRLRGLPVLARDGTLVAGLVAGALFGVEFLLIYRGLLFTTASRASLFIYLAPFFVVLGARIFLPADRFSPMQWAGLVLAFIGMMVAFGVPAPPSSPYQLLGDLMMAAAALAWATTTLVIKVSPLSRVSAEKTLLYQLLVSIPILAGGALVFGERIAGLPSGLAVGALTYQVIIVGFTYSAWFALIVKFSASRLSAFTFLTPLFGVAAGHFVLGEPLTPGFALAVALVAGGLILVNRPR